MFIITVGHHTWVAEALRRHKRTLDKETKSAMWQHACQQGGTWHDIYHTEGVTHIMPGFREKCRNLLSYCYKDDKLEVCLPLGCPTLFMAFRCELKKFCKENKLTNEQVKRLVKVVYCSKSETNGGVNYEQVYIDKDGRIPDWPEGMLDEYETLLTDFLTV